MTYRRGAVLNNDPAGVLILNQVGLERFKAAFKPKIIKLDRFTVVVGRNGSGKSTLLEALQWLDVTLRRDAVVACERYVGMKDLVNLRAPVDPGYFTISCTWKGSESFRYRVKVEVDADDTTPRIIEEKLSSGRDRVLISEPDASDRLTLARFGKQAPALLDFWKRAVFLRLSPSSLAEGSLPRRTSNAPLLDEEGETLPALLSELSEEQRQDLVHRVNEVLPGMRGVEISKPSAGRSERVHYELIEEMKYKGRLGQKSFHIPAWMLSEGTRRLTALFALLVRVPAPSLLCIEEVENGLDPWAARILLRHLREAADRGTQIIATTHSPWVLDEIPLEDIVMVRRRRGDSVYERFDAIPEVQSFSSTTPAGTRYAQLIDGEDEAP